MKRVGIILRNYKSNTNHKLLGIRKDLIEFLDRYDISIICIPINFENSIEKEYERVEEGIKLCDGIILPGGADLYPIDPKIAKYLYDKDIPTLGICLGMQIIGSTFNGNLDYVYNHQSEKDYVHTININENSKLFNILNEKTIKVNSRHNEAIFNTDLKISSLSNDYIIESIEDTNKKFFIGLQWHPESLMNDKNSIKIFDAFVSSL